MIAPILMISVGGILIVITLLAYRRGHFSSNLYKVDRKTMPSKFHSTLLREGALGIVLIYVGWRLLP